jgi:hypothetical protein
MAEIITSSGRKAIKKIAQISQCARALGLMPNAEDFALRIIGDLRFIAKRMNNISIRINDILDRYSAIPAEFLLEGFDELLKKLDDINDYAKFTISETTSVMSSTTSSVKSLSDSLGYATSATTSATLQVGGGLTYSSVAMAANIKMAWGGDEKSLRRIREDVIAEVVDGKIPVADMEAEIERRLQNSIGKMDDATKSIKDWTVGAATNSTNAINGAFGEVRGGLDKAIDWIDNVKAGGDKIVDDSVGVLMEKVENAKRDVEDMIERVRKTFDKLTKDFDEVFGWANGKNLAEMALDHISNTASGMGTPAFDGVAEITGELADFIKNFNIGKVVTAFGGIIVGAGAATLAMDILPRVDVSRMLKNIIGGVDTYRMDKMTELYNNKYYENAPDLLDVPDVPWRLSKDDLEKYNAEGYNKYLEDFAEENDRERSDIVKKMEKAKTRKELSAVMKENREKMKENKSALKAMRKVRRNAIKAKQMEKYKGFLKIELDYLKRECLDIKISIKNDWDAMMNQYKVAIREITKFFTEEGCGGSESIDRCCDRINEDAEQIVELCSSIAVELTNAVAKIPTPYAVGMCVDMPVHKILSFFEELKIIVTFLKNLIRLGIDIISQFTILAKIVANGLQSLADIMKMLMDLVGVDRILNMIDFLVELFRPKMVDAKILLENSISPIYYNETEEYEARVDAIWALLEDDKEGEDGGGYVDYFRYTNDQYDRDDKYNTQFGGNIEGDENVEKILEELEAKGEREIYAYRSPILNAEGDDFAGWIFYHPYAYNSMDAKWSDRKKRRRNKVIKDASKKNKMRGGKLVGGVAKLKQDKSFGYTKGGKYYDGKVTAFDAYYWYTKWTNDPTDCEIDLTNEGEDVVSPVTTTSNGSLVRLSDGRMVFVEGRVVQSGDYVNVDGKKYRVK